MLIKIGSKFYTAKSEKGPIMVILSEDDVRQIVENHNNPQWQRKLLNCPSGYFKNKEEKNKIHG